MRILAILVVSGCGRIGFDPFGGADPDGSSTGDDGASSAYRDVVIADHPIGYYRLGDEPTAIDEIGGASGTYVGTCMRGAPALIVDPDAAMRFAGNCRIELGDRFDFAGQTTFTIEAWVDGANQDFHHILTHEMRDMTGPLEGYALVLGPNGAFAERVWGGTVNVAGFSSMQVGHATHVVGVFDGIAVNLYIDGALFTSDPSPGVVSPITTVSMIGASTTPGNEMVGTIDEVAIYAGALDPARIALHYAVGVSP